MHEAEQRIIAAALECFAQFGVTKTTIEDVASAAGCSRATLYRYFGGKQALLYGVVTAEVRHLDARLWAAAEEADTLEDLLVGILGEAGRSFAGHDALQHLLAVEPEAVLPHLAFDRGNRVLAVGAALVAPHLAAHLDPAAAGAAGEWITRVALTYLLSPSEHVSLTDEESVRRLVRTFVLPGLEKTAAVPAA